MISRASGPQWVGHGVAQVLIPLWRAGFRACHEHDGPSGGAGELHRGNPFGKRLGVYVSANAVRADLTGRLEHFVQRFQVAIRPFDESEATIESRLRRRLAHRSTPS